MGKIPDTEASVRSAFRWLGRPIGTRIGAAKEGRRVVRGVPSRHQLLTPMGMTLIPSWGDPERAEAEPEGVVQARNSTPGEPPGFTATATANLDSDDLRDHWHVNDLKQNLAAPDRDDATE